MKILLTDIFFRKAFDVINILKRHYSPDTFIYAFSKVSWIANTKAKLIYGTKEITILRNDNNFNDDLANISKQFPDEDIIFLPIEETTTRKFLEYLEGNQDATNFRYLLPQYDKFDLSNDKEALNLFCIDNHIPCPAYISEQQFESRSFEFPIILKPKHGSGSKDIRYLDSEIDLQDLKIDFKNFFVQERLTNPKDVQAGFYLCDQGEIISFYSHQRIRTYPESGGVTVFSKCKESEHIEKLGKMILQKLNWSGLVMIEFLFDERDHTYKLIEINPRLWGSVLLSEFCGAEFLKKYVDLSVGTKPLKSPINYHTFIRWVFPYDVMYWLKNVSNPFKFFKIDDDTCYINFTYSNFIRSLLFIALTYFNFNKIGRIFRNG